MRSLGGLLFFLGAGSVVLHLLQREFLILAPLTPYQPWAGIVVALIGVVLIALGDRSARTAETVAVTDREPGDTEVVRSTTVDPAAATTDTERRVETDTGTVTERRVETDTDRDVRP